VPTARSASAQILEIIGEIAQRPRHGSPVPACLVLNPISLHGSLSQQVLYVDGQISHGSSSPGQQFPHQADSFQVPGAVNWL